MDNEQFDLASLPAGASYYDDGRNIVYYRGDSTNTAVSLPDGKDVASITPTSDHSLYKREDGAVFVIFASAIKIGVMVEIVLRDEG